MSEEQNSSTKTKIAVKPKIRHDWYQTETDVTVTILLKNVDESKLKIDYGSTSLHVKYEENELDFRLLNGIVPIYCTHKVTPSKIEVKLVKAIGIRWEKLEADAELPKPVNPTKANEKWEQIARDFEEEKPEGDAALNALFQKIYGESNEDVRRAMNKSFMESGGTVLSTNWNEVGKEKVEVRPPDGMEYKKWDS
ncbi:protein SGT1 homolog [Ctenocephalides felis]|uniref:protein SGT1 homolog n=1 Tax=Ctenocephalides felis TaxID=7515 RepID=UPI000E6E4146|nr:protein SGT1 homolog [Ctenocephalides felis]